MFRYLLYTIALIILSLGGFFIYSSFQIDTETVNSSVSSSQVQQETIPVSQNPPLPETHEKIIKNDTGSEIILSTNNYTGAKEITIPVTNNDETLYIWVAIASSLTSIILTLLSGYLYFWRIRISDNLSIFVPEEQIKRTDFQINQLQELRRLLPEIAKLIDDRSQKTLAKTTDIEEIVLRFHGSLDLKDKEILLLKQGYEANLHSRFLGNFFRLYKALDKVKDKESVTKKELDNFILLIENAFENAGVEFFFPNQGINYRDFNHLFKSQPREIETDYVEQDMVVESVISPGLRSVENEDHIIIPAEVRIYRFKGAK